MPLGQSTPTVAYTATLNGAPVNVGWQVDAGAIGKVGAGPSSTATFTPSGTTGGMVNVVAGLNGTTLTRPVMVKLTATQNGSNPSNPLEAAQIPMSVTDLTKGGGVGGVGGEGLGPAVTDPAAITALGSPTGNGAAQGLAFVYPYDKTVWPRGLLAPLLQWSWSIGDADAIEIALTTSSGSFSYTGTFAKPPILQQTGGKFIRHPIPEDIWDAATNTAGGTDTLTVSLIVEKGGQAYGPITETWTIAPARLSGIIYYQSYGTQLAQNLGGAVGGNGQFGGAVLSIHGGDTGPKLVAGTSGGLAQCRVCHSVAANGSRLVVQHGDNYNASSAYDLTPTSATETNMTTSSIPVPRRLSGRKSSALTPGHQLLQLPTGTVGTVAGLAAVATSSGTPAFAPDGKSVAFNPMTGPIANPTQKLVVMQFDKASSRCLLERRPRSSMPTPGNPRRRGAPGWPAFSPGRKERHLPRADGPRCRRGGPRSARDARRSGFPRTVSSG